MKHLFSMLLVFGFVLSVSAFSASQFVFDDVGIEKYDVINQDHAVVVALEIVNVEVYNLFSQPPENLMVLTYTIKDQKVIIVKPVESYVKPPDIDKRQECLNKTGFTNLTFNFWTCNYLS